MKDKLKIGMYIRTDDGFIAKLVDVKQRHRYLISEPIRLDYIFDGQVWDSRLTDGYYDDCELGEEDIEDLTIEPSYNILDLVREGDYVNGEKIIKHFTTWLATGTMVIKENDIKDILTKEQFESMIYKVNK